MVEVFECLKDNLRSTSRAVSHYSGYRTTEYAPKSAFLIQVFYDVKDAIVLRTTLSLTLHLSCEDPISTTGITVRI